jgi:hypothetical protein
MTVDFHLTKAVTGFKRRSASKTKINFLIYREVIPKRNASVFRRIPGANTPVIAFHLPAVMLIFKTGY